MLNCLVIRSTNFTDYDYVRFLTILSEKGVFVVNLRVLVAPNWWD